MAAGDITYPKKANVKKTTKLLDALGATNVAPTLVTDGFAVWPCQDMHGANSAKAGYDATRPDSHGGINFPREAHYSHTLSTRGTATAATIKLWGLLDGEWHRIPTDVLLVETTVYGHQVILGLSAYDRLFVELSAVTGGTVTVRITTCLESI